MNKYFKWWGLTILPLTLVVAVSAVSCGEKQKTTNEKDKPKATEDKTGSDKATTPKAKETASSDSDKGKTEKPTDTSTTETSLKQKGTLSSLISFEDLDWEKLKDIPFNKLFELKYVPQNSQYSITYMGQTISSNSPHGSVLTKIFNSKGEENKFDAFIVFDEGTKYLIANFKKQDNKEEYVKAMYLD